MKVGDKVRCKPGFSEDRSTDKDKFYGGAGYKEGIEFIIEFINGKGEQAVIWPPIEQRHNGGGIYKYALELVNQQYDLWT